MADLSLDDFIKKNNVKVKINNPSQAGGRKPQQNQVPKNRLGVARLTQKPVAGGRTFDARQKLAPRPIKQGQGDARNKILNIKKTGGGDARNKIVQKQVKKGTFDVRTLLQRKAQKTGPNKQAAVNLKVQAGPGPAGAAPLTRTLSNPNARAKGQVLVTNTGLSITRPQRGNQVSMSGMSLKVTRKNQPPAPKVPFLSDAIPIIQIRNDRFKQPAPYQPAAPESQYSYHEAQGYDTYGQDPYEPQYSTPRGYRDLDDPQYNPHSVAVPDVPKMRVSNIQAVEHAGMRPVSYSETYPQPSRAPPGAATVSLSSKQQNFPVKTASNKPLAGVKRRSAPEEVSGPLRLGRGGGPGIDLDPSPNKRTKPSAPADVDVIDLEEDGDYISPLQGFRVVVSNLVSSVTQDDIIELFGAVGPLKKAKLLKSGTAEVVYVNRNDAINAGKKYHCRELDGQPMYVKMTTPAGAQIKKARGEPDPDITGEALRLYKKSSSADIASKPPVEVPTIHRALFKAGPPGPNKSVRFTVKI